MLGFRRIGSRGKGHQSMELTVHDDRSNKYNQSFSLDNQNLKWDASRCRAIACWIYLGQHDRSANARDRNWAYCEN